MNLTGKQVLLVVSAVLSALVSASAQLTDIFGAETARAIISVVSLANTVLTAVTAALIGQGSLVKDVAAMPGVSKVLVNEQANSTLATVATDPGQPKVGAIDAGTRMVLQDKAKGA
jgi:uncharacterized PurR-regulated membrane protein YhhQ (DUF165 family)